MLDSYYRLFSRFLFRSWEAFNSEHLGAGLRPPVFRITKVERLLGSWDRRTRTISISEKLFLNHSELEIEQVLKHEMAHQYADEVLRAYDANETAHGSAFQHACTLLEIRHHARYRPESEPDPMARRIQKLLALAESQNIHEAELAMAKARDLMDKYESDAGFRDVAFHYCHLGKPVARKSMVHQLTAGILARFFNVALIWTPSRMPINDKSVWLMEVSGTATNLDIAAYVHEYLGRELDHLWRAHRAQNPHLKGVAPKRDFQVGVLRGLFAKLDGEGQKEVKSGELVLLKKEKLRRFFEDRHPDRVSGRRMTYRKSSEYEAGFDQGRKLEIRKGIKKPVARQGQLGSGIRQLGSGET